VVEYTTIWRRDREKWGRDEEKNEKEEKEREWGEKIEEKKFGIKEGLANQNHKKETYLKSNFFPDEEESGFLLCLTIHWVLPSNSVC
jgi:hypothetical protein